MPQTPAAKSFVVDVEAESPERAGEAAAAFWSRLWGACFPPAEIRFYAFEYAPGAINPEEHPCLDIGWHTEAFAAAVSTGETGMVPILPRGYDFGLIVHGGAYCFFWGSRPEPRDARELMLSFRADAARFGAKCASLDLSVCGGTFPENYQGEGLEWLVNADSEFMGALPRQIQTAVERRQNPKPPSE